MQVQRQCTKRTNGLSGIYRVVNAHSSREEALRDRPE
jgi:hypothetical protein